MVLNVQFVDHVLPLEKKSLLEMQKKMRKYNKHIHLSIYLYTLLGA